MSESRYTLHVWPAKWNLHSLDPTCLAAVSYLQLTIPGKFSVAPCTNPDVSPNGQLPFLTHAHTSLSTFPSIVAFVSSLAKSSASGATDLDASLTGSQRAQKVALHAHVETHISDLVSYLFYGIDANFWGLTHPALASEMPVPQKYYVARRIRESYRPRLEAAGLWSAASAEEERGSLFDKDKSKKQDYKATMTRAFEREKILDKAKTALAIHANHLNGKQYFFGDRPTSLDVYLAAHILLIVDPPFPDAVLQTQIIESFPGLIIHARNVQIEVARVAAFEQFRETKSLLGSLVPRSFRSASQTPANPEDVQFRRRSLLFAVAAFAALTVYCATFVLSLNITADAAEADDDDDDDDEGDVSVEGESVLTDESRTATDEEEE